MPAHFLSVLLIQAYGLYTLVTAFDPAGLALVAALQFWHCGLGIDLAYHRLLSHKSFRVWRPLEVFMIFGGAMALQGDPVDWVCIHRQHHRDADRDGDPHNAGRSLWFAHMGWIADHYLPNVTEEKLRRHAGDVYADPFCAAIHRHPLKFVFAWFGVIYWLLGGWGLAWGVAVRYLIGNNLTWAVNSVSHRFGWRAYERRDLSTNCYWLALLTTGGAFHNNHHAFPASARHGFARWQLDVGWQVLRLFRALGLASRLREPTAEEMAAGYGPANLAELIGVVPPGPRRPAPSA